MKGNVRPAWASLALVSLTVTRAKPESTPEQQRSDTGSTSICALPTCCLPYQVKCIGHPCMLAAANVHSYGMQCLFVKWLMPKPCNPKGKLGTSLHYTSYTNRDQPHAQSPYAIAFQAAHISSTSMRTLQSGCAVHILVEELGAVWNAGMWCLSICLISVRIACMMRTQ